MIPKDTGEKKKKTAISKKEKKPKITQTGKNLKKEKKTN